MKRYQLAHAIVLALKGDGKTPSAVEEDEEVIDTTTPEFARQFQGFIGKG